MTILTRAFGDRLDATIAAKLPAAACAFVLGLVLIYGVGLANPAEIHNAAHDGRHTFAFPCH